MPASDIARDVAAATGWLPLFPLKTVLFPGGVLPLKVFETRYIDMVRECLKDDRPFGVVLIRANGEAGMTAVPEDVGCIAHVTQSDAPSPGILMLRTVGGERFRILESRALGDGRLEARIETIDADTPSAISQQHLDCAKTLKIVIEDIERKGETEQGDAFITPFSRPLDLQSAGWVANRWCEILPIPMKARQKLLELADAQSRLSIVHQYLKQHKIL